MYDRQPLAYFPSTGSHFDISRGGEDKASIKLERQDSLGSVLNLLFDFEPLPFYEDAKVDRVGKTISVVDCNVAANYYEELDWITSDENNFEPTGTKVELIPQDEYIWSNKRKLPSSDANEEHKKGKWSKEEDVVLRQFAQEAQSKNGKLDFKRICKKLRGRTPKQVREHWLSTLNPDLKKGRWTKEEELYLIDMMIIHGKAWSTIAKTIKGRAEHSVKAKGRLLLGERIKAQIHPVPAPIPVKGQLLLELHRQYGTQFEEMSRQTGYALSPAKIERELLHLCNCNSCSKMTELIKSGRSPDLHHGWTRIKAKQIKEKLMSSQGTLWDADLY